MCSNPYIDETLLRQRIADARAFGAQCQLLNAMAPARRPGVWAGARRLLGGVHWTPQCWLHTMSGRDCRHRLVIGPEAVK